MSKTKEELFKDFLKEYEIEDEFEKEYFRDSAAFDSYQLRYYGKEIVQALISMLYIEKIVDVIKSVIEKIKGVKK